MLGDDLCLFTFSDAEVTVSQEEAIDIALNNARDFNWVTGEGLSVKTDSIPRELAKTKLNMQAGLGRDPFTLYPFWRVDLWLGKTYPGGVSYIAVRIWADTGEVVSVKALGVGGGGPSDIPADLSPSQSSDTSPTPSSTSPAAPSAPDSTATPDQAASPDSTTPPAETPSDTSTPTFNPIPIAAATAATALYLKKKRR